MLAIEMVVPISNHRLVVQGEALPAHAERARVIVMWDAVNQSGRRSPPLALAGLGTEHGELLTGVPSSDWEALS
ncbi:MAG: hypothetical protein WBL62_02485 [Gallionella sp.]